MTFAIKIIFMNEVFKSIVVSCVGGTVFITETNFLDSFGGSNPHTFCEKLFVN